ncbi:7776_t:CDS:2 [Funneliformis mosseae]|uniref:7776_t:CDS:1 n=1 Tax=Funneliformis mosseae TaxID=27381 RepID=A0A9N9GA88_FUNMO|nr:7776_t:CDS:2 [Funneliformis mosseae]
MPGTTDIAILTKGYSSRFGQQVNGCKVTIELKQGLIPKHDFKHKESFFQQIISLTMMFSHTSNKKANDTGNTRNTERELDRFDNESPPKRRKQLNTFNMQISDITNFNDFADTMPDIEVMSKMIERYKREI